MFGYCPYLYSCKMKMMKKYCALLLLLVSVLSLSSCSNRIERLQRQVRLEGIESVHLPNYQTLQMDLRVLNDSPHKLVLKGAEAHLYYKDYRLVTMRLNESVEAPKRSGSAVYPTYWDVEVGNLLSVLALLGKVRQGDLSDCSVDLMLEGRGGPVPINLSREKMPLSEFLRIFGLDSEDLTNLLK